MCGIIGILGENSAVKAFNALKKLDYRGYDSWGIASKEKNEITLFKQTGKLPEILPVKFNSNVSIAHTRWATHGSVTEFNAHPHISSNKKIAAVHNGIIENFEELKESLKEQNYEFYSETDSEVIPNLVQFYMEFEKKDFITAVIRALSKLEGNYAVLFMHEDFNGIIAAKNGSPLVCGIGENEFFFASDVPAFLSHTKKAVYLNDLELAVASNNKIHFFDLKKNKEIQKETKIIEWNLEQAEKGNYAHFMIKEIYEQPETIKLALEQPKEKINEAIELINKAETVFLIGCGTSFNASLTGAYFFSELTKIKAFAFNASEFSALKNSINEKSLIIALTQSGETADLIDAVKFAKEKKSKIISIVNVMGSSITQLSDLNLMMNAGPEICVLSTKSFSSQLTILLLLASAVAGKTSEVKKIILNAANYITELIPIAEKKAEKIAEELKNAESILVIGRKEFYPLAMESALKIKEVSYIHAEGYAGGELKHGPIALIEKDFPVIVLSSEKTRVNTLSNAHEIKSRGAKIIGIDSIENKLFNEFIEVKEFSYANALVSIIPVQLLAYYLALEKGFEPDKPRNLAKSVTVR
ncbi:MAG: glutamine--fructose-6-phosphate transaminase (isomerizing) [Candidatus Diapherotrites archaeon]|nr:glutamine--fructose-6-phosphate transaminase (isomerizing) [Candidatus Diapherotrites archaeon]